MSLYRQRSLVFGECPSKTPLSDEHICNKCVRFSLYKGLEGPRVSISEVIIKMPKNKLTQKQKLTVFIDTGPDGPGNFVEQDSKGLDWVAVRLSEETCHTNPDLDIMEFVIRAIQTRRAALGDRSLYQPGNRTISFPIAQLATEEERWREAEKVAKFMQKEIYEGRCVIDRRLLFVGEASRSGS